MLVYYIDTNAILRFLLKDNLAQYSKVKKVLTQAKLGKVQVIILREVIPELIYVLMKVYKLPKARCLSIVSTIVESEYIDIYKGDREIIILALEIYSNKNIDIIDAILIAQGRYDNVKVFSFDNDINNAKNL